MGHRLDIRGRAGRALSAAAKAMACLLLAGQTAVAGELVFATDGAYAPFSEVDASGRAAGFEAALVAELCAVMEASCRIEIVDWATMLEGLADGRFDAGYSGITPVTAGALGLDASVPHTVLGDRFVARADASVALGLDNLDSFVIGALRGTPHALWLEKRMPPAQVRRFPDAEEMYLTLQSGGVDLVLGDALSLQFGLLLTPLGEGLAFTGPAVDAGGGDAGLVFLVEPRLKPELDRALEVVRADGRLAALRERYLPGLTEP